MNVQRPGDKPQKTFFTQFGSQAAGNNGKDPFS